MERLARWAVRMAAVLLLGFAPAWADGLTRTQPGHIDPRPEAPMGPSSLPKPSVDKTQPIIVLRSEQPVDKLLKHDLVLSNACRDGRFDTLRPNRFVARFTKATPMLLEAVPESRRDLLVDRDKLARPGEDYFFLDAGWSNCKVYYKGPLPPRVAKKK